jgi:hypothetical protein
MAPRARLPIVRHDPPPHEAGRLQASSGVCQGSRPNPGRPQEAPGIRPARPLALLPRYPLSVTAVSSPAWPRGLVLAGSSALVGLRQPAQPRGDETPTVAFEV